MNLPASAIANPQAYQQRFDLLYTMKPNYYATALQAHAGGVTTRRLQHDGDTGRPYAGIHSPSSICASAIRPTLRPLPTPMETMVRNVDSDQQLQRPQQLKQHGQ
jgi:hypothetical protein